MQTVDVSGPQCMKLSMFGLPIVIPVNAFRAVLDTLRLSPVDGNLRVVLRPIDGHLDKSNSHLFSKSLLSKDRLFGVNPWHNYQMLAKTDAI